MKATYLYRCPTGHESLKLFEEGEAPAQVKCGAEIVRRGYKTNSCENNARLQRSRED